MRCRGWNSPSSFQIPLHIGVESGSNTESFTPTLMCQYWRVHWETGYISRGFCLRNLSFWSSIKHGLVNCVWLSKYKADSMIDVKWCLRWWRRFPATSHLNLSNYSRRILSKHLCCHLAFNIYFQFVWFDCWVVILMILIKKLFLLVWCWVHVWNSGKWQGWIAGNGKRRIYFHSLNLTKLYVNQAPTHIVQLDFIVIWHICLSLKKT